MLVVVTVHCWTVEVHRTGSLISGVGISLEW